MLLELAKALSFFASLLSLYPVAVAAFFDPGRRWEDRVVVLLPRVAEAACACLLSGLLFLWPSRSNPDRHQRLVSTLPLRLFFWAMPGMTALFLLSWYIVAANPCYGNHVIPCR